MKTLKVCSFAAIALLTTAFIVPSSADGPAVGGAAYGYPDLDVRTLNAKPAPTQLAAADRMAAAAAAAGKPAAPSGVTLRWNGYGTPQLVRDNSGYLTGPSGKAPAAIVRDYLEANADLFRLTPKAISELKLVSDYPTKHNGASHVGYQLTDSGLPVFRSIITATVDARGRIVIIGGSYAPDAVAGNAINLDETAAIGIALEAVGVAAPARLMLRPSAQGFAFENTVAKNLYRPAPLTAELVSFPMGAGMDARIAWRTVTAVDMTGTYETVIDAETGDILFRQNRVNADHGAEGNVYRVQNPTLGSPQITTFIGIDGSWVDDRTTDGNNAIAYHDLDDTNTVGYQPQTPDNTDPEYQHFNYTYTDAINTSGGTDVTTDRDAVITQAFYYVNMLHDYYYNLGFDEVSRNFQDDNFGRGGMENDRVLVEVDNGFNNGDCCNAFMDSNNDGTNGRLTLRVGLEPDNLNMHRAMNGDTVTHEYGHGVSNRLVGSGDLGSGVQTGALGEGWSDALATELWNDPVYGEYNNGNADTGIRGVAYDTSTMVYSDLCSWSGGCQVHNDGRIWATVMWQVRAALIDTYGLAAGAATHVQLMIDGMKNTPTDPSYLDARDGYLAADVTNNAGANQCLLWRVFAEREMGFSAASVGNSSSIIPDTDVPVECVPTADAGGPYFTQEGQPETVDGSGSAESSDPSGGSIVSYAWDLDNDGDYDDAFGVTASFDAVGQDGVYTIGLQVTNEAGIIDTDSTTVTVANVAPTVTISASQVDEIDEFDVIEVTATFTDPGWLDTYTYEIDWGTPEGDTSAGNATVTTEGGPGPDIGEVTDSHQYGDNGAFTITVTVFDDDDSGSDQFVLTVHNVDPTAVIDLAGTIIVNGVPAIVAHVGEDIPFSADSADPGSDDLTLTWDWDDGAPAPDVSSLYLVNPPAADPLPSPSVDPRDLADDQVHAFTEACLYEVVFASTDDDSGSADDSLVVIISGNVELTRSAGYWYQAYRDKKNGFFTQEELECFLDIVGFMSTVFNEETDVSTIALAANLLRGGSKDPMTTLFDRQLLAVWLNFANGALDLETLIDTDGDDVPDTSFADVISAAEAARLNPATTDEELEGYKDLLETINENSL